MIHVNFRAQIINLLMLELARNLVYVLNNAISLASAKTVFNIIIVPVIKCHLKVFGDLAILLIEINSIKNCCILFGLYALEKQLQLLRGNQQNHYRRSESAEVQTLGVIRIQLYIVSIF